MSETITYIGEEAVSAIVANVKEKFSQVSHNHDSVYDKKDSAAIALAEAKNYADDKFLNMKQELNAYINESIYGVIDGEIESISNEKAKYIRDYGFYYHSSLKTATFVNVENIGDYAFYKSSFLTTINATNTESIGVFAFKGTALNEANFPNATVIGNGTFDECLNLSSVNLGSLQEVSSLMFRKCTNLTTVDLPVVERIGSQAFYNSGITHLILHSDEIVELDDINAFAFTPIEEGRGFVYVNPNLVSVYKTNDKWSTYADQIVSLENYSGV